MPLPSSESPSESTSESPSLNHLYFVQRERIRTSPKGPFTRRKLERPSSTILAHLF